MCRSIKRLQIRMILVECHKRENQTTFAAIIKELSFSLFQQEQINSFINLALTLRKMFNRTRLKEFRDM